jgi:hypothetical protein
MVDCGGDDVVNPSNPDASAAKDASGDGRWSDAAHDAANAKVSDAADAAKPPDASNVATDASDTAEPSDAADVRPDAIPE